MAMADAKLTMTAFEAFILSRVTLTCDRASRHFRPTQGMDLNRKRATEKPKLWPATAGRWFPLLGTDGKAGAKVCP